MKPRMIFASLALLSQTGCVAAIPLAAQLVTSANSTAQLCSMTRMPGQTTTLCDRISSSFMAPPPVGPAPKTIHKSANGSIVDTAER